MSRTSLNRLLNASTLSSGSSNTSMMDQGTTERSSSKLDFEKNVKERRIIKVGSGVYSGYTQDYLIASRIYAGKVSWPPDRHGHCYKIIIPYGLRLPPEYNYSASASPWPRIIFWLLSSSLGYII